MFFLFQQNGINRCEKYRKITIVDHLRVKLEAEVTPMKILAILKKYRATRNLHSAKRDINGFLFPEQSRALVNTIVDHLIEISEM